MKYRVRIKVTGRDAALSPDLVYANGRYEWLGPKVNAWVTMCYQQFGLMPDELWSEVQRPGASDRLMGKS